MADLADLETPEGEIDRILNNSNILQREQVCQPMCNVLLYCLLAVMIHNTVL